MADETKRILAEARRREEARIVEIPIEYDDSSLGLTEGIVYKVWIEVEAYDIKSGSGETVDLPFSSTATFRTIEEAEQFAAKLHEAFSDASTDLEGE